MAIAPDMSASNCRILALQVMVADRDKKLEALRAENARLTTDKERLQGAAVAFTKGNARLHAEIVALRAENADLRENLMAEAKDSVAFIRKQSDMIAQLQRAALALTEQNERLREALMGCVKYFAMNKITGPAALAARKAMGESDE